MLCEAGTGLKDNGQSFVDTDYVHVLVREDGWFERGVKEASLNRGGGLR